MTPEASFAAFSSILYYTKSIIRRLVEDKVVPVRLQKPLPAHFAQFIGQGAAVHIQVVGQLLAAEGDVEFQPALLGRLEGEIGEKPAPDGFGGGVEDAPGEGQIFVGGNGQQIGHQTAVMGALTEALVEHPSHIQPQNLRRLRGHHAHHHGLLGQGGVGLSKDVSRTQMVQHTLVAPYVVALHRHPAGQKQPHGPGGLPGMENHAALGIAPFLRPQTGQHLADLLQTVSMEEGGS